MTAKNVVVMKINRLHIKKNLIKEFQEKQVSFKLIVLKFIQAYLKSDRWHLNATLSVQLFALVESAQ